MYDAFVVPYIGELNRQNAVTNINNPSTEEHNKLGKFLVDSFNGLIQSGREGRILEHNDIKNDTQYIPEMYQMMKNGTD